MEPKPLTAAQPRPDGLHRQALNGHIAAAVPEHSPLADADRGDWHDLLNAVKARLRQAVGAPAAGAADCSRIQADVLDCVTALDQLHALLAHELGQGSPIEREPRITVPPAVEPGPGSRRTVAEPDRQTRPA